MLNLKAVNEELARRGHRVRLAKGDGYFYFWSGEAVGWLDRTVIVPKISSLTLVQWVDEFLKLRRKNEQIQKQAARKTPKRKPSRRPG